MTQQTEVIHQDGDVIDVPLNKLKKSPCKARRTPHAAADIEALATSIPAKGIFQALVVESEWRNPARRRAATSPPSVSRSAHRLFRTRSNLARTRREVSSNSAPEPSLRERKCHCC